MKKTFLITFGVAVIFSIIVIFVALAFIRDDNSIELAVKAKYNEKYEQEIVFVAYKKMTTVNEGNIYTATIYCDRDDDIELAKVEYAVLVKEKLFKKKQIIKVSEIGEYNE